MPMTRRRMLMLSLGGSALLTTGYTALRSSGHALVTRRGWALGSDVTMTVACDSTELAENALDAAFAELETVEQVMSLYRPHSQVCRLNRDKLLADPHPYLVDVLTAATTMSRQTEGAFDITVQTFWDLHSKCLRNGGFPTEAQIEAARQTIDWQCVEVTPALIRLHTPAEFMTLNGIAQGFAADRAVAALQARGIQRALVNTGEIGSLGSKTGTEPWIAGVQHPRDPDAYSTLASLDGRSLATSGDYETTFSADFSRNHIFDPRTGQSPRELASVTIVAACGMQADALSTAAMVLGPDRTLSLVQSMPDVDAFLVLKSGRTLQTRGFPATKSSAVT